MLGASQRRTDPPSFRLRSASAASSVSVYELADDDEVEIDALCSSCCRVMTQAQFAWLLLASGCVRVCC